MTRAIDACDDCTRRSRLVARLAGHLEQRRADREAIRAVLALPDEALIEALGGRHATALERDHREVAAAAVRAGWEQPSLWAACRHSERYPGALEHLPDVPAVIHGAGRAERLGELLTAPAVAVVGARRASPSGLECARVLGRGLSAAGVTVVSGMALGVDAAAHEGALEAGGNTIAVLACGADVAYPRTKRPLHGRLRREGAVVSELPPGTTPFRWAFPARNRIIAALAGITVVVEAAERSGSLITADLAISLGRDVAAVPGSPLDWRAAGTNQLLRDGASLVTRGAEVMEVVGGYGDNLVEHPREEPRPRDRLTPVERRVLEAVPLVSPARVDSIAHVAALHVREVDAALRRLQRAGFVDSMPTGWRQRQSA